MEGSRLACAWSCSRGAAALRCTADSPAGCSDCGVCAGATLADVFGAGTSCAGETVSSFAWGVTSGRDSCPVDVLASEAGAGDKPLPLSRADSTSDAWVWRPGELARCTVVSDALEESSSTGWTADSSAACAPLVAGRRCTPADSAPDSPAGVTSGAKSAGALSDKVPPDDGTSIDSLVESPVDAAVDCAGDVALVGGTSGVAPSDCAASDCAASADISEAWRWMAAAEADTAPPPILSTGFVSVVPVSAGPVSTVVLASPRTSLAWRGPGLAGGVADVRCTRSRGADVSWGEWLRLDAL